MTKERKVFFSVLEDNPQGIALIDGEERFIYINPEFTNITGYTIEELPCWGDWTVRVCENQLKADTLSCDRIQKWAHRITCKDGQHKDVECRIIYLEDKSFVVLTDVTAQKRAEEGLRAEKHKFETVCENLPLGMVMIGADGAKSLTYVNPKFKEVFGYGPDDVPEINEWVALVYDESGLPRDGMPSWISILKNTDPQATKPRVRKVRSRDNKEKYVKFIPIQLETGEILMTCEDVTLSMQARKKLQERNLELEALNDLIAPVSTSLHLPQLLKNMKRIFAEKLEIDAGCMLFCSGPSNKFNVEVLWGVPDSMRTEFETFALHCYRDGIAIYEGSDVLKRKWLSPPTRTHYGFQQQEWKGYLCISLLEKGETQGIAFLVDKNYERFGDDRVAFYRAVGEHITVATQNARLFERVKESEIQMKALSQLLVNVQEAERRYVARELHDEIGQVLTELNLALEMHTLELGREPTARLLEAKSTVHKLVAFVRELSLQLRPSILDDLGLFPTLRWYFDRFYSKTNTRVLFEHEGADGRRFAIEVETAVYRIVQEALTNVARHAKVNEVAVRLWCEDKAITVQVEDHGLGFDLESALRAGRTGGLRGMRERALVLGGYFTVETNPGSGTCLTAELPTGDKN